MEISKLNTNNIKIKPVRTSVFNFINCYLLLIILIVAWYITTTYGIFPPTVLPSIPTVLKSLYEQLVSGQLIVDIGVSLARVLAGYTIAAVLGISLGVVMGIYSTANNFFKLVFNTLLQIPTLALIPMLIIWFGIGETTKLIMILKSAFFPILFNTISGIRNTPQSYIELAKLYKLNKIQVFTKIYFPSAMSSIFVGLKLALGVSWATVVAAELIAATSGIGFRIADARMMMTPEVVIVGIFSIGLVGTVMDIALSILSKKLMPWQSGGK